MEAGMGAIPMKTCRHRSSISSNPTYGTSSLRNLCRQARASDACSASHNGSGWTARGSPRSSGKWTAASFSKRKATVLVWCLWADYLINFGHPHYGETVLQKCFPLIYRLLYQQIESGSSAAPRRAGAGRRACRPRGRSSCRRRSRAT